MVGFNSVTKLASDTKMLKGQGGLWECRVRNNPWHSFCPPTSCSYSAQIGRVRKEGNMKSDVIVVSSTEDKTDEVLEQAEKVSEFLKLSSKDTLHLRLLAEEMMSMVRAIAGKVVGDFWIETKKEQCELHLNVRTAMDFQKRAKLLSTASSGKNEAHRGFMGKIRAFFEPMEDVPVYFDASTGGLNSGMVDWTMCGYQEHLKESMKENEEGAAQAWDELEKSVIGHLADDVKVSIRGYNVEMVIYKKFA